MDRWSFLEKYVIGHHPSPVSCCKTAAPISPSEASAIMQVGACGFGCNRRAKSAMAFLMVVNHVGAASSRRSWCTLSPDVESLLSGSRRVVQWGMKQW